MPTQHIVVQGEHAARIARQHGLVDYRTLWNRAENAELRKNRDDPSVLFPGDSIFVPEHELKEELAVTDKRHRFQVKRSTLMLRVVVRDVNDKPVGPVPCVLHVEAEAVELATGTDGMVERRIPEAAEAAALILANPAPPSVSVSVPLKIGYLDPVDTVPGQLARLNNLGYDAGPVGDADRLPSDEEERQQFRSAVEEFQCDQALAVDGLCGPVTQARLKKVHGC